MDECRRVGKDNGDMMIENYMDKAELQTNYIEQVSFCFLVWLVVVVI